MTTEQSLTAEGMTDTTKRLTRERIEEWRVALRNGYSLLASKTHGTPLGEGFKLALPQLDDLCDMALAAIPAQSEPVSEERICELAEGASPACRKEIAMAELSEERIRELATKALTPAHFFVSDKVAAIESAIRQALREQPTFAQGVEQCIAICRKQIDSLYEQPIRAGRDVAANSLEGCIYTMRRHSPAEPGMVSVPVEPTEAMLHAGHETMFVDVRYSRAADIVRRGYKAMLDAAKSGSER